MMPGARPPEGHAPSRHAPDAQRQAGAAASAAPPPLRVLSLRHALPGVLLAVFALVFATLAAVEYFNYRSAVQSFADQTVREQLLAAWRGLENGLRRQDRASAEGLVAELGLEDSVRHAVLLDERGLVLAATRFAWRSRPAVQAVPELPAERLQEVRRAGRAQVWFNEAGSRIGAAAPVSLELAPGELRAGRTGVLFIEHELSPLLARTYAHLRQQLLAFGGVAALALALLMLFLRRLVMAPVDRLRAGMAQIGEGRFDTLPRFSGGGEFRQLAEALARMAGELRATLAAQGESEARYRQLSEATFEAILLHEGGRIIDANQAAEGLFGCAAAGLVGRDIFSLVAPQHLQASRSRAAQGLQGTWEVEFLRADGSVFPAEVSVRERSSGGHTLRVVAVRDISERLRAQEEIRQLAYTDALTGLPNRRHFLELVAKELQLSARPGHRAAVASININGFSAINESLGMAAGDDALRTVAQRLQGRLQPGQSVARVDGDSFACLFGNLGGNLEQASAEAARACEGLLGAIGETLDVDGHALQLSAAAGIVMLPNDSQLPAELLREAETAMNRAKEEGRAAIRFFAHSLQEAASARLALRNDLRSTLRLGQGLLLHYQPQVDSGGRQVGMEALVRWQHPGRGMVSPVLFIPEAESSGLIVPLGNWVLEEACRQLRAWQRAGLAEGLSMAINVSPRQFREQDFARRIEDTIASVGLEALSIELELTESVVADDLEATVERMRALRQLGVRFALDDFGTGYSSLAYLKRLPIDTLKIDRSFVVDIAEPHDRERASREGRSRAVLIDAIIAMAHRLDLAVLAEGVETDAQLAYLRQCGCDVFQGYYFSRPLAAADMEARLRAMRADAG